jgi:glycosyltransferase involved in cell wall biosynthesis
VVAHVSTYPPRKCGIALYTRALVESMSSESFLHSVLAVDDGKPRYEYDERVRFVINASESSDYVEAAKFLNESEASVVSLQHEYGIFGGDWGSHILKLSSFLKKPMVTTFHTILSKPPQLAARIVGELASESKYVIVTLKKAANLLIERYEVPENKITLIHHGAPIPTRSDPRIEKANLGLSERRIALTMGFLSPAKGIEYSLRAVKMLMKEYPDLTYIVVGETHPSLKAEEGEAYRKELETLVTRLGLAHNVMFIDRFVSEEELAMFVNITDVYIAPYRGRDQVSSGTLTRAVASGKAIVATPTPFAKETLIPRRGLLCEFDSARSIARQARRILSSPRLRKRLESRAGRYALRIGWQRAAEKYAKTLTKALEV